MTCHMSARLSDIFRDAVMLAFPGMIGLVSFMMVTVSLFLLRVLLSLCRSLPLICQRCIIRL